LFSVLSGDWSKSIGRGGPELKGGGERGGGGGSSYFILKQF